MSRLGINQPYCFPYIGYFQLIAAVDDFVLLDDVSYIKRGWINRNRILHNKEPLLFTIPLSKASQNKHIKDIQLHASFDTWRVGFLKTLEHAYKQAPYFDEALPLIESCLDVSNISISELAARSLKLLCQHLGITTNLIDTSSRYETEDLKGQDRIIAICEQQGATSYINLSGGKKLYSSSPFKERGISLSFIQAKPLTYDQGGVVHQPWLSIIDVLMWNPVEKTKELLTQICIEEA